MRIEFHTPHGKVTEKLVNTIRNEVLEFSHINKKISRAEVWLKEDADIIKGENKICEISLKVYGEDLFVHSRAESFEKSAKGTIKELKRLVIQQVRKQKEPPDQTLSAVKV